jgi:hypothetical protein
MSGVIRKSANSEGPAHPPVYQGKELVPTERSPWLWQDPETGRRFIVSPQSGGAAPVGQGYGRPGRSGRKPKVFKEFCNEMLRDPAVQERLRDLAVNGAPDDAMRAINTAAKYSQPLPRQEIDQSSRLEVYISGPPMGCERDPEELDDAPSAEPERNGQPEFEVLIGDESVMGKEDEERRRRTARSLRDAWT